MENYNKIQPEVIVGIGNNTVFEEKEPPFKTINRLHIELEDWLGDDLVECYPVYIVTDALKKGLEESNFSGFKFAEMEITKSEYFDDNYQLKKELPNFYWMKIIGQLDIDEILIGNNKELFIKPKLVEFIKKKYNVKFMEVNPERNEFDDLLDNMIAEGNK